MRLAVRCDETLPAGAARCIGQVMDTQEVHRIVYAGRSAQVRQWVDDPADAEVGAEYTTVYLEQALHAALRLPPDARLCGRVEDDALVLGPCLAVYSERRDGRRLFGEQTNLFADLARIGATMGVDVIVLTPGDWSSGNGWRWIEGSGWQRMAVGEPDVVLRRSGSFRRERFGTAKRELAEMRDKGVLHTLPRECSNKWKLYEVLRTAEAVRPHLPHTVLATSPEVVWDWVHRRGDVYVKPVHGDRGRSVLRLRAVRARSAWLAWQPDSGVKQGAELASHDGDRSVRRLRTQVEWERFWTTRALGPCIVQDTVALLKTADGRPMDFRWLIQWTDDQPTVVARVARIGRRDAVTTNVHTGGTPCWAVDALSAAEQRGLDADWICEQMDRTGLMVAEHLRRVYGPYAECGVDLGVDDEGDIYVLEVNPTPGRRMLRVLDPAVRGLSLRLLLEYAIRAAGFAEPLT